MLGAPAPRFAARDLGGRRPVLRVGAHEEAPSRADLVPADLGELVAFAASFLAAFGETLEPGDLILSGSYLAQAPALTVGAEAVATFGPLGSVSARIA